MPRRAWRDKRERQYERIKQGLLERGTDEGEAEEIAARTVNKERVRQGEALTAGRTSVEEQLECALSSESSLVSGI